MNKTIRYLIALPTVAGISAALLIGADLLTHSLLEEQNTAAVNEIFGELLSAARYESLPSDAFESVDAAYVAHDKEGETVGYGVTVSVQGYVGRIEVHAAVSADGTQVKGIRIGAHNETAGYGARITSTVFTRQFDNVSAPLYLSSGQGQHKNGVYRAMAEEAQGGFRDTVELTLANGEITAVNWDAVDDNGNTKKALSKAGEYVMSETGLPWHEQANIMEQALLYTQDPTKLVYDPASGKTDAYTGATIDVSPFVTLATQALAQAGGSSHEGGSAIDGISGATTSSKAVIAAVNTAVQFVQAHRRS